MKNKLPKYWVVENKGETDYQKVFDYLNNTDSTDSNRKVPKRHWTVTSKLFKYYGYDGSMGLDGINASNKSWDFKNNPKILTLEQFLKLSKPIEQNKMIIINKKLTLILIIFLLLIVFTYSFFIDNININMTKKDWLELLIMEILAQEILTLCNKIKMK